MASLKERMALFKKSSRQSDADDHAEFKKKSGNKEQPDKVGKLNHSYMSRDSGAKAKRNFKIPLIHKKKKEEEKPADKAAEDTTAAEPTAEDTASGSAKPPPKSPRKGSAAGRISTFIKNDMTGMLKNPFLHNDKKAQAKVAQKMASKKDLEENKEEEKDDEEEAAALEEGEDAFVIPEGDEEEEEEEEEEQKEEKPKRGALRALVQQSQRLSLGVFTRKKLTPQARSQSVDVMESRARSGAGIRLHKGSNAPPPRKSLSLFKMMGSSRRAGGNSNKMNAYNLVLDKARAPEVEEYLDKIHKFDNKFTLMKRLSIRDNDIVQAIQKVIGNDPKQTSIKIDTDVRFNHLRSSMVQDLGDSIRKNLYLKSLTIVGVELGNTFLESLASAIRDNVTLKEIDLSRNSFTHDALVEFCQALELNHTITTVRLQTQLSPVYEKSVETVLEALSKNRSVKTMTIDFQGDIDGKYDKRLKEITQRNYWNKDNYPMPNPDDLLVNFLKEEVVRAEELHQQEMLEKDLEEVREGDWDYLYELSVLFDRFKIKTEDNTASERDSIIQNFASPMHLAQSERMGSERMGSERSGSERGTQGRNPLTGAQGFPSDGSFLTEEFIDAYLQEDPETGGLVFNFCNQVRLFKQFPSTSPDRETIVNIFVFELLHHPRQDEFTGINMTNTGCGNDFWEKIAEAVLEDPELLPNVNMISAETNFLTEPGLVAIANMIKSEDSLRYLQVIKLDNQKALLSSKAERALARAMCVNLSIIRFSLRVRNLLERDQCNKYVLRNIDFLRQARRHHKINTGTLQARKRNAMEQYFDSIAANDESITEVNISADIKFTGLNDAEKVKAAKAFATNTHVTKVLMNQLQLGDKFAIALGEALENNNTIQRLVIEGNAFTGVGFKGIFAGLGKNSSVKELLAAHQTKSMSSPDEQALPGLLEGNTTITKISLDLRNSAVTMQLDKICSQNRHKRITATAPTDRKRNEMEKFFDKIAANDETITEVNLSADVKFTGLSNVEKVKSAKAFATNSHVTKVTMNQLQLGDDFLIALGESLETNTTIERLVIEGNAFTGPGFKGLFSGLGKNSSVKELLGKHQTKSMSSSDEQALPAFIEENTTLSKISLDLRNSAVTMALDKICNRNNADRRRKKNSSAVAATAAVNAAAAVASTPAHLRDSTSVVPVPVPTEKSEDVAEEKPFDEEAPDDEKSPTVVEKKAASREIPFDERSDDQPFDEAAPEDEVSPPEEVPMDEAPMDEVAAQKEEEAVVEETRDIPAIVQAEGEEIEVSVSQEEEGAPEDTPAEEKDIEPDAPTPTQEGQEEEAPVTSEDTPAEEEDTEPETPAIVQVGEGDEIEVTAAPEAAQEDEAPSVPEDAPAEEKEAEAEAPAVVEEGEGDEIEAAAPPEAETAQEQEEVPTTHEENAAEDAQEEDASATPEDAPAEEKEVEAEAEEVAAEPEAETAQEEEEAPATPEDAPAEEKEVEGDAPSAPEDAEEVTAPPEEETAQEEEEVPATPGDAPTEEKEVEAEAPSAPEDAPEEDAPEENAPATHEDAPAEEKEGEAEAEEVAAEPEAETAQEEEEAPAAAEDTLAEEKEVEAVSAPEDASEEVAAEPEAETAQEEEGAPATAEDTPAEEKEVEAEAPAVPEDAPEEVAAEPEAETAQEEEEAPAAPEDTPAEDAQEEEAPATPEDAPAEEKEVEAEAEEVAAEPEAETAQEQEEAPATAEDTPAEEKEVEEEAPSAPADAPAEEKEVEATTEEVAAAPEAETTQEQEAPATPEDAPAEEKEAEEVAAAPEEQTAKEEEEAPTTPEDAPAEENESEPSAPPAVAEAGESEVAAAPAEGTTQEVEPEPDNVEEAPES